ncbi:MAG: DUF1801 domain-containing protein [Flavobacteriales bacterium]|nr:DUF1801 domain-containing protein [Bacteroidota bacterium]MCB9240987.1 DUF1801 domain-containing protein [Flavobacteriales bacterium]
MKSELTDYYAKFPQAVQERMQLLHDTISSVVPEATTTIKYGIPTFVFHGNLVHYGGFKHHIGFYPGRAGVQLVEEHLTDYKQGKGSVQFPNDQPLPLDIVRDIVAFRKKENLEKQGL